jgi:hypothetical protein
MNRTQKKHIILIVGSGRSGTSMLTEILSRAGCYLGEELIEANQFNERGYFENRRFVEFHRKLLAKLGRAEVPGSAIKPPPDWVSLQIPFQKQLQGLLEEFVAESTAHVVAVKDPRASLLLPLWISAADSLNFTLSVVLAYRNPIKTIDSVVETSQCSRLMGESLFIERTCAILDARVPVVFFDYDECLANPQVTIRRLLGKLQLPCTETFAEIVSPKARTRVLGERLAFRGTSIIHRALRLCNRGFITQHRCGQLVSLIARKWRQLDALQDSVEKECSLRNMLQTLREEQKKSEQGAKVAEAHLRATNSEARCFEWFKHDYINQRLLTPHMERVPVDPSSMMIIGPVVLSSDSWEATRAQIASLRALHLDMKKIFWLSGPIPESMMAIVSSFVLSQGLTHSAVRRRTFDVSKFKHWLQTVRQHALHIKPSHLVIPFDHAFLGAVGGTVAKSIHAASELRISETSFGAGEEVAEACALCDTVTVDTVNMKARLCRTIRDSEHAKIVVSAE